MGDQPATSNEPSNVKLDTPFWPDRDMVWLKENQEKLAEKLVAVLEKTELEEISDILLNPPVMKYDAIKARLVSVRERRLGRGIGWLLELLTEMKLSYQKPSCLLQRMRNIVTHAAADVPDATLRSMWMNQLTMDMQTAIVIMESLSRECTLDDLAKVADKLIDFETFDKQLTYMKIVSKPSQMLINLQILDCHTPSAYALPKWMEKLSSPKRIAIAVRMTMNSEFTVEELEALANKSENLDNSIKGQINQLAFSKRTIPTCSRYVRIETDNEFMIRVIKSSSDLTPLHVWMTYLPQNVQTAIAIRQALDSNCTLQELAQLADKMVELQEPNK